MFSDEEKGLCVDKDTKKVCIEFFGFFPYEDLEDIENFFQLELELKENEYVETYIMSGAGYKVCAYLMPMSFNSLFEAEEFVDNVIKESDYVNLFMFEHIAYLDADKVHKEVEIQKKNAKEKEKAKSIVNKAGINFCKELEEKYSGNEYIKNIVSDIKIGVFS